MQNATDFNEDSLVNEANSCLDKIKQHPGVLRDLVRTFHDNKLHLYIAAGKYEDNTKGMRKCLKNELDDKRLYSSVCRWLQAFHVEDSVKIGKDSWPLTILLKFYRYKSDGWQKIADEFENKDVPSMDEFENCCIELLEQGEISLKRQPSTTYNKAIVSKFMQIFPELEENKKTEIFEELARSMKTPTKLSVV